MPILDVIHVCVAKDFILIMSMDQLLLSFDGLTLGCNQTALGSMYGNTRQVLLLFNRWHCVS